MKILNTNILKPINNYKSYANINFRADNLKQDTFEYSVKPPYKRTVIKDIKGNDIPITIVREETEYPLGGDSKKFVMQSGSKKIGHAIVLNNSRYKGIYLNDLYTEENSKRQYKGAGRELIKCAIEESQKRGKKGEITCCAYHETQPPFAFYYKQNFAIKDYDDNLIRSPFLYNAVLQYVTANNVNIFKILPRDYTVFYMTLDKYGAKALLEDKQLYKERICEKVATDNIEGEMLDAYFVESPKKGEYFLMVLNESMEDEKLCFLASLKKTKHNNKKCFEFDTVENDFLYSCQEVDDFAQSVLNKFAKKYL